MSIVSEKCLLWLKTISKEESIDLLIAMLVVVIV